MIYPARMEADSNATQLVTFPDFPEAATFGDGVEDALLHAQDALLTAVAARIEDGEEVPLPSPMRDDLCPVELPAMAEAKILLWRAMREANVRKPDLARKLGWAPPEVDRLLDPDHASRLDHIEAAVRSLGKRLALAVS